METNVLGFVAAECGGELVQGSPAIAFRRVTTDSRQAREGDLFVALVGERFDGHDFVGEVANKGAVGVVVEQGRRLSVPSQCGVIEVANSRRAYGAIAAAHRREFDGSVIAVAGSNGKTSTKELIAAVLGEALNPLASEASFNNDVGVPATLLRLQPEHRAAVVEVGTNHPGELGALVPLVQPQYGVITNIGREHLEYFGDLAGVAREEGTLAELLPPHGKLFLNGDDAWSDALARRTRAGVVRVGCGANCDWRADQVRLESQGCTFKVTAPDPEFNGTYWIRLVGRHQVTNALFAIALGAELGVGRDLIKAGLKRCEPAKMRLQVHEVSGVRILDDTYNANADSMLVALQVLQELPCKGRRVAVLGDMAELGVHGVEAHAEVGRRAAELGVEQLITVGKLAAATAQAAREAGLSRVIELADVEAATSAIRSILKPGDVVLLKASRSARLERVTQALQWAVGSGK